MSNWKLGYPLGLSTYGNKEADGKEEYDKFSVEPITLASRLMNRGVGVVSSTGTTTLNFTGETAYPNVNDNDFVYQTSFSTGEFAASTSDCGFMRVLSCAADDDTRNKVYQIESNTASSLTGVTGTTFSADGLAADDTFEIVSGACTFEFPAGRNPIRRDFKRNVNTTSLRFPYYEDGLVMFIGYEADDFVIHGYLTEQKDADRLEVMLNHHLDYRGADVLASIGISGTNTLGGAPMVLETGSNDILNQFLVYVNDYKIVKDSKRSDNLWDFLIHFMGYSRALYRGI
jgi:hypothetical protein